MISVTALSSYQYCARKLYLERVLRLVTKEKAVMIRGSVYHGCLEDLNRLEESLVRGIVAGMQYPDVVARFIGVAGEIVSSQMQFWRGKIDAVGLDGHKLYPEVSFMLHTEARNRARDVFSFIELNGDVRGDALWEAWTPKRMPEQKISLDDLGLRGIIDCVLQFDGGSLVPIEYKTGKSPKGGVWPGHKVQVAAYAVMLERVFKTQVNYGIIRYLDDQRDEKVFVNPFLRDEVLSLVPQINSMLASDELPARCLSPAKCEACDFKARCHDDVFIKGRLALAVESKKTGIPLAKFFV